MLSGTGVRPLPSLDRLAIAPETAGADAIDWQTPIDRSRWYFCETLTPLYYTAVYRELAVEHRRRYNQLTGMLATEVIALLETEFLEAALRAVDRRAPDRLLSAAVERFRQDEERHAEIWRRLRRLSQPELHEGAGWHLVRVPAIARLMSRIVARYPVAFPVVFWIQLVQEERSVELSRRCMRMPADRIEPRYAAAFASHVQDEVRHVQIDRHLIERYYRPCSPIVRRMTARLLKWTIRSLLLVPVHSTARVVEVLASEYPEVRPLVARIRRELRALEYDDDYHEMMYSRRTTPVTFALFDEYEEFHGMRDVLRAYRPELPQRRAAEGVAV